MKKMKKKGFTIVELAVVIAIVAILAAVVIPTFANVVEKAKKTAAIESAKNAYTDYLADVNYSETDIGAINFCIESNGYYFHVVNGQFNATPQEGESHTCTESLIKKKVNDAGKLVENS